MTWGIFDNHNCHHIQKTLINQSGSDLDFLELADIKEEVELSHLSKLQSSRSLRLWGYHTIPVDDKELHIRSINHAVVCFGPLVTLLRTRRSDIFLFLAITNIRPDWSLSSILRQSMVTNSITYRSGFHRKRKRGTHKYIWFSHKRTTWNSISHIWNAFWNVTELFLNYLQLDDLRNMAYDHSASNSKISNYWIIHAVC